MSDFIFRIRSSFSSFREYRRRPARPRTPSHLARLRAGVAGAHLPPLRLPVPHRMQQSLGESVPACVSMVLESQGRRVDPNWAAVVLGTDEAGGAFGDRLATLAAWGIYAHSPDRLQFFRDAAVRLSDDLLPGGPRVVYQWEERWLRYVTAALRADLPPILFVDVGALYPAWRGLTQAHAVVLCGGEGRFAWIQDPARTDGPVRIDLETLMDALLPNEALAVVLHTSADGLPALDS